MQNYDRLHTGIGPRSFGSSVAVLRIWTGILSLGSSCSDERRREYINIPIILNKMSLNCCSTISRFLVNMLDVPIGDQRRIKQIRPVYYHSYPCGCPSVVVNKKGSSIGSTAHFPTRWQKPSFNRRVWAWALWSRHLRGGHLTRWRTLGLTSTTLCSCRLWRSLSNQNISLVHCSRTD